jgi:hypothetical protein
MGFTYKETYTRLDVNEALHGSNAIWSLRKVRQIEVFNGAFESRRFLYD